MICLRLYSFFIWGLEVGVSFFRVVGFWVEGGFGLRRRDNMGRTKVGACFCFFVM